MPASVLTNTIQVQAGGRDLSDDCASALLSASVEQSLSLPDTFTLVFRDPARTILKDTGLDIGSTVKIAVATQGNPGGEPLIEGAEVTALEAEYTPRGTITIVRGMDKSFRAYGGRTVISYPNSTLADAAKQAAGRAGLSAGKVDSTSKVYTNLTQNNLSDWSFIRSLAREAGFDAWVSDGKLNFCKPTESSEGPDAGRLGSKDPLQLTPKDDLISFRCAVTAGQQVGNVKVRGWDPVAKKAVVGTAPAKTTSSSNGSRPDALAGKLGNPTFLAVEVPRSDQDDATQAAKVIAETIGGSSTVFEGLSVGNPKLKAGTAVSIGLLGKPFDGKYTLTEARHTVEADGYTTWFAVNGRNDRSLLGLASGAPHGDALGGRRIPGVVTGIVTDAKDPEEQCRVKLSFPWLSDDYQSDWARNTQVWAGKGYGSVIVPEVGDEVLVAFEQGDIHRPFVLGGLYNGVDPPYQGTPALVDTSGKVNRRDLVSRTGHVISMTELAGQNDGILVKTAGGGYKIELSKQAKTVTIEADGTVIIEAKGTGAMTIKAAGNLDISARQITMKAQSGITIDGGAGMVDIKAGPKASIAAAKVEVNGSAAADLKGGGMVTIQGALVKIN
ncbi:MAG: VgrG-related protein [Actinomycetota bacterium]